MDGGGIVQLAHACFLIDVERRKADRVIVGNRRPTLRGFLVR